MFADGLTDCVRVQTKCQQESDDEDDENGGGGGDGREQDGRDDAEYDAMLISTGGDLLPVITSIACAGKVPFFPSYLSSVIPKLQKRLVSASMVLSDARTYLLCLAASGQCFGSIVRDRCTGRDGAEHQRSMARTVPAISLHEFVRFSMLQRSID